MKVSWRCPLGEQVFASLEELIEHLESFHKANLGWLPFRTVEGEVTLRERPIWLWGIGARADLLESRQWLIITVKVDHNLKEIPLKEINKIAENVREFLKKEGLEVREILVSTSGPWVLENGGWPVSTVTFIIPLE